MRFTIKLKVAGFALYGELALKAAVVQSHLVSKQQALAFQNNSLKQGRVQLSKGQSSFAYRYI